MTNLKIVIGHEICSKRRKRGYSQTQLANLVNVSTEYIVNIEFGKLELDHNFINKIRNVLDDKYLGHPVDINQAKKILDLGFDEEAIIAEIENDMLRPYAIFKEYIKKPTINQVFEWIEKNYKYQYFEFVTKKDLSNFDKKQQLTLLLDEIKQITTV